jgi:ComF family protein
MAPENQMHARSSMKASKSTLWRRLLAGGLRQSDCILCLAPLRDRSDAGGHICAACTADMPLSEPYACTQCAASITSPGLCGSCLSDPPAFDAAVAACTYAFPVSQVISQFKYGSRLALAGWMAEALAGAVTRRNAGPGVDWILPLPLSRERILERGFNQAALIAAGVARRLSLPLHRDELLRVRNTTPQASLDHDARWRNVKGAFEVAVDASIAGQRIALVDDVMTTGATMDAAARALRKAGATRVEAWVVARADLRLAARTQIEGPADV